MVSRDVDQWTAGNWISDYQSLQRGSWDPAVEICNLHYDYNTFPGDWFIEKAHQNILSYDRHRIAVRGELRGTAQRVYVRLKGTFG